eukprot:1158792-Pelagomonas_calceolata.AAC.10
MTSAPTTVLLRHMQPTCTFVGFFKLLNTPDVHGGARWTISPDRNRSIISAFSLSALVVHNVQGLFE